MWPKLYGLTQRALPSNPKPCFNFLWNSSSPPSKLTVLITHRNSNFLVIKFVKKLLITKHVMEENSVLRLILEKMKWEDGVVVNSDSD